jgi:uncharacterized protein
MSSLRRILVAAALAACIATPSAARADRSSFAGAWAGSYGAGNEIVPIRIDVKDASGTPAATFDLSGFDGGFEVQPFAVTSDGFTGTTKASGRTIAFSVVVHGDGAQGTATVDGREVPLALRRIVPLDLQVARSFEGAYRAGSTVFLIEHLAADIVTMTDQPSGVARILFPVAPAEFVAGSVLFSAAPEWRRVRFAHDAGGARMTIDQDGREIVARRLPLRTEPVTFSDGDVRLAGTLILPAGRGPHPAVVFTHGSGPNVRSSFSGLGFLLAMHGVAALKYDKRGVGDSTGDYAKATFADLADDAAAGARMLQTRPDIDPRRIGFWGLSQGSSIAPLAASRAFPDAFVIAASGGGASIDQWSLLEGEGQLRSDGRFSENDIRQAMEFERLRDRYMRTRQGWDEYAAALSLAVKQPWYNYPTTDLFGYRTPDSRGWDAEVKFYFYDPVPSLRSLRGPFLGIYGANDPASSNARSIAAIRDALSAAGNHDVTLRVLPGANHNMFDTPSQNAAELPRARRFAPSFFPLILTWVDQHLTTGRRSKF